MPNLWIMALDSYAKSNGFRSRAQVIRSLFYPAFARELERLETGIKIEPIIEKKRIIKKFSIAKKIRRLRKLLKAVREESTPRVSVIKFVQSKNRQRERSKSMRTQLKDHINIESKEKPFSYLKDTIQ